MKHIYQLICICYIIGLVVHVQEVTCHQTLDIENDGEAAGTFEADSFESADSNAGASGGVEAVTTDEPEQSVQGQSGEGLESDFAVPAQKPPGLSERFVEFFKHEPQWYWSHYSYEIGYVIVFILAIIKFQIGKGQNDRIATVWRKNIVPIIFSEFPHMGCGDEPKNYAIMQKTYADYEYFASGRKNCKYAEFHLNLIRRHCALTEYGFDFFNGNVDRLVMEIAIDTGGKDIPLELLICKKKDLKSKMKSIDYLSDFVKNSAAKNYKIADKDMANKNLLAIMSEHDEIANQIIDAKIGQVLQQHGAGGLLHEIHITDQKMYNTLPLFMRVVIEVPNIEDSAKIDEFNQLFTMALNMIDTVANLKLSPGTQQKCVKSRKKQVAIAAKEKENDLQEKKMEQKRVQDQVERERLKRMTPEEQAKYEKKQKAKEDKRSQRKYMKVMK